ncbi:MAG: MBL fold metallo-hydrolase [Planctomycetia bacterium]|nr:MBL fold metallo-hydrolase [Planctomycetia bacterium]
MKRRNFIKTAVISSLGSFALNSAEAKDQNDPVRAGTFKMAVLNCQNVNGGAGLAIVMQTPHGKTWLFDTGTGGFSTPKGTLDPQVYNCGRDTIFPYLKKEGIKEIEGLLVSHGHGDHMGGLEWILKNVPVRNLYDSGYRFPGVDPAAHTQNEVSVHLRLLKEYAERHPGHYFEITKGAKLDWDPDLKVAVLSPPKEFFKELPNPNRMKRDTPIHHLLNANSLAIQIKHGKNTFLIAGDIQEDYLRKRLWPILTDEEKKCDVCILPSHGIHSIKEEAEATRPKIAVASVWNPWAKSALAWRVYKEVGAEVYATGIDGNIEILSDGEHLSVKTEKVRSKNDNINSKK